MRSSAAIYENDVGYIGSVEQKALELIRRFNDPGREHAQQSPQRWRSRLEGRLYV